MRKLFGILFFVKMLLPVSVNAIEVRKIYRSPYTPQKWDLGAGVGFMSANSNLVLIDLNGSFQIGRCGSDCLRFIEISGMMGARDSQTHYALFPGLRLQKHWNESSWSPYVRVFAGGVHSIEFIDGVRDRFDAGLAVGTYYYLHPKGDLRIELRGAMGGFPFVGVLLSSQFKFDEAAQNYKGITPEGI